MKDRILPAVLVLTVFLLGCSSTKYTEYHGTQGLVGPVGTARNVDGIDFWENGIPGRKFKILGTINQGHKQRLPLGRLTQIFSGSGDSDDQAAAIAKIAHKHGGDAVILVIGGPDSSDDSDSSRGKHRRSTLVVAKYVE